MQTIWAELIAGTLADAGVKTIVISPGSRSTPLVLALASLKQRENPFDLVTIIDERAAAFYALGVARATGLPAALVCTSGTAASHYVPAIVEASMANVPMIAITADRPPELLDCGASQTIDQIALYGKFVRGAFDLGAPVASVGALRAVRRKVIQALTLARGPVAGPVHIEVPLRKPLEPAAPSTDEEHALAALATSLRGTVSIAAPTLLADEAAIAELAAAIAGEPDGVIIAGSMPASFAAARNDALSFAERAGYPVLAEMTSQLRVPSSMTVAHLDLIPIAHRPTPRLVVQIGSEPVAASWPAWSSALEKVPRWVLAESWADPTSNARVILGDPGASLAALHTKLSADRSAPAHTFAADVARRPSQQRIRTSAWLDTWRSLDVRAQKALEQAIAAHPHTETAMVQAALTAIRESGALLQVGNSLPIRVVDQVATTAVSRGGPPIVLSQRGAAGIDGLIASAAGATRSRRPVLLILGDVSYAHDVGALIAAQNCAAYLAILVIDNQGGQIFAGLPVARSEVAAQTLERHWLTPPKIDPVRVAQALGVRGAMVTAPEVAVREIQDALNPPPGSPRSPVTVIHALVTPTGAHDVRRTALELFT
ncbi:MAG TPA: 2-succinyl-5-enolpyruvyl-6-hydroxy-3-cyclohexene-1-carboxylic-acid synthase [Kofleriaceae bacterium]